MTVATSIPQTTTASRSQIWTGRVISALPALFLLMDAVMKLIKPKFVVDATVQMGYPEGAIRGLGIVLLVCTLVYLLPETAALGAMLLTGYLGGAVATHLRAGQGPAVYLFPVVFGLFIWVGLVLRQPKLRAVLPFRR